MTADSVGRHRYTDEACITSKEGDALDDLACSACRRAPGSAPALSALSALSAEPALHLWLRALAPSPMRVSAPHSPPGGWSVVWPPGATCGSLGGVAGGRGASWTRLRTGNGMLSGPGAAATRASLQSRVADTRECWDPGVPMDGTRVKPTPTPPTDVGVRVPTVVL